MQILFFMTHMNKSVGGQQQFDFNTSDKILVIKVYA